MWCYRHVMTITTASKSTSRFSSSRNTVVYHDWRYDQRFVLSSYEASSKVFLLEA